MTFTLVNKNIGCPLKLQLGIGLRRRRRLQEDANFNLVLD
jgi:hypothetical protein